MKDSLLFLHFGFPQNSPGNNGSADGVVVLDFPHSVFIYLTVFTGQDTADVWVYSRVFMSCKQRQTASWCLESSQRILFYLLPDLKNCFIFLFFYILPSIMFGTRMHFSLLASAPLSIHPIYPFIHPASQPFSSTYLIKVGHWSISVGIRYIYLLLQSL